MEIKDIRARQIIDSRGNPTVEVDIRLNSGALGRAAVPSGASTGKHEAHELRDEAKEFNGLGVKKAIKNIELDIWPRIRGIRADDQYKIDQTLIDLDGTANKTRLGANAVLAVSLACAHASANERKVPLYKHIGDIAGTKHKNLPMPMMNILNGGAHASGSTDIQETMIIPVGAKTIAQAVQMGVEVFHSLKSVLKEKGYATTVGDEGGFAPHLKNGNTESLDLVVLAIQKAGYNPGQDVMIALDVASSEIYSNDTYHLTSNSLELSATELIGWYQDLILKYPIVSIEDGIAEDEWDDWQTMTSALKNTQLVGDDLLVTNVKRLQKAIDTNSANAILIKPNQIGTLMETIKAVQLAKENGFNTIISHRSGETEDTTIAHIAVGLASGQIKTGSLSRSERTAKYNELMRIEESDHSLRLTNPF